MTETAHAQQLRAAILGEFYFGVMCRDTTVGAGLRSRLTRVKGERDIPGLARRWYPAITAERRTGSTIATSSRSSNSDGNE